MFDTYCYTTMSFGLKNVSATYQQCCSGRPVKAWFYSRSSTRGSLSPRDSRAIHPGAGAHDH
jgi:hypothetical protein